jgi:hypothetical protein
MVFGILCAGIIGGGLTCMAQSYRGGELSEIPLNKEFSYSPVPTDTPNLHAMIIPEGTFLYRTSIGEETLTAKLDEDTDKTGLYFANYPLLAMGMALEYNTDMIFNVYRLKKSVVVYDGKYSFRTMHQDRYFNEHGFIPNVNILESENINHLDREALPIINNGEYDFHQNLTNRNEFHGEVFIAKHDLDKIEKVAQYKLSVDRLKAVIMNKKLDATHDYHESLSP